MATVYIVALAIAILVGREPVPLTILLAFVLVTLVELRVNRERTRT